MFIYTTRKSIENLVTFERPTQTISALISARTYNISVFFS